MHLLTYLLGTCISLSVVTSLFLSRTRSHVQKIVLVAVGLSALARETSQAQATIIHICIYVYINLSCCLRPTQDHLTTSSAVFVDVFYCRVSSLVTPYTVGR